MKHKIPVPHLFTVITVTAGLTGFYFTVRFLVDYSLGTLNFGYLFGMIVLAIVLLSIPFWRNFFGK